MELQKKLRKLKVKADMVVQTSNPKLMRGGV